MTEHERDPSEAARIEAAFRAAADTLRDNAGHVELFIRLLGQAKAIQQIGKKLKSVFRRNLSVQASIGDTDEPTTATKITRREARRELGRTIDRLVDEVLAEPGLEQRIAESMFVYAVAMASLGAQEGPPSGEEFSRRFDTIWTSSDFIKDVYDRLIQIWAGDIGVIVANELEEKMGDIDRQLSGAASEVVDRLKRQPPVRPSPSSTSSFPTSGGAPRQNSVLLNIPHAFLGGEALMPTALAIQGVLASLHAAQDTTRGWRSGDSNMPVFEFMREQGTARVSMRPDTDTAPGEAVAELLWGQVREFSDKDGDVLLAMMAQAMQPGQQDKDGATWITASTILDYRGIRPIMKREGKVTRRAGHRTEDLAEITDCVNRLSSQWVELVSVETRSARPGKRQPKIERLSYESKLFSVDERIMQREIGGPQHAVAWRYRLGRCITEFLAAPNRQVAQLMQQVLEYDPYRQSFEKRLGRYFTIHHRIGASYKAPLRRKISRLFDELYLPINKSDPSRTMKRFETAMDRLSADNVIPGWSYTAESATRVKALPARSWLSDWLSCVVEIPTPKAALRRVGNT